MSACASTPVVSVAVLLGALQKLQRASWALFGRASTGLALPPLPLNHHHHHHHHHGSSTRACSNRSQWAKNPYASGYPCTATPTSPSASSPPATALSSCTTVAAAASASMAAAAARPPNPTAAAAAVATAIPVWPIAQAPRVSETTVTVTAAGWGLPTASQRRTYHASSAAAAAAAGQTGAQGSGHGGHGGNRHGGQDRWRSDGGGGRGGGGDGGGRTAAAAGTGATGANGGGDSSSKGSGIGGGRNAAATTTSSSSSSDGRGSSSGGSGNRRGRDWNKGRSRGSGVGGQPGGGGGGSGGGGGGGGGGGEARAASPSSSTASSPPPSPPPSPPSWSPPPPLPPSAPPPSGPLAIRHFPHFSLVLHRLPPLAAPRTPAEQRCLGAALSVVARLRNHGYTAMFAGGWVRDQFLCRPSADIDLVTNATTVQIFDVFGPRQAKLKGGATCDVTVDGIAFEVTSYRGGLHDDCEEAEWRDAACRDFTINGLFFDPKLPHQHQHQHLAKAGGADGAANSSSSSSTPSTPSGTPVTGPVTAAASPRSSPPPPQPPSQPPALLPDASSQPAGVVKDYVGGLADLRGGRLRVFRNHTVMGNTASSVEMDPLRVLRAARLSVELGLVLDPYTEDRVRRAAARVVLRQNGVTGNRVYRELAKMNDLDKNTNSSSSSSSSSACGAGGGASRGGGSSGDGGGGGSSGRRGSPLFAEALERCREWRALEALFPRLPQEHLKRVISRVLPRLPYDLPLELKLSCLAVAPCSGGSEVMPWNLADKYDPITSLLSEARQSAPGRHYPGLLCALSDLLLTDYAAVTRQEDWARVLAAEGADKVQVAMEAFMPRDWQRQLRERLAEHRAVLAPLVAQHRARQQQQQQHMHVQVQVQMQMQMQQGSMQQRPSATAAAAAAAGGAGGGGGGGGGRLGGGLAGQRLGPQV